MNKLFNFLLGTVVLLLTMCVVIKDNPTHIKTVDNVSNMESITFPKLSKAVTVPEFPFFKDTTTVDTSEEDTTLLQFEDYVSDYSTMCDNSEQIKIYTEHYIMSNDSRVDVAIQSCEVSGNSGHIVSCHPNCSVNLWYNEDAQDYYINLVDSDDVESGWCELDLNSLDSEFYMFVKNQFSCLNTFNDLKDVLCYIDTDSCKVSKVSNGCMLTCKASMSIIDKLQPVYLNDGELTDTYVHVYILDDDILLKVFYIYTDTSVDQEVYTFKFKTKNKTSFIDFSKRYNSNIVDKCTQEDIVIFYEDNIRR